MFMGSVPSQMRSFVVETVRSWQVTDLFVGCSGNFTIERCLPDLKHHGNDVTLYSSAVGWWAAGQEMPITLNEEKAAAGGIEWLAPYVTDRDDLLATLMLGTRFLNSVGRDNRFHRRQVEAHRDQWDSLHSRTVAKLRKSTLKLETYACKDVRAWLAEDVTADDAVVTFPPFFGGDYEAMFEPLEAFFDWTPPTYDILDEQGKVELVERIADRKKWAIGLHHRWEALEDHLRGVVQTTNRGVPIYLYASDAPMRVVAPRQKTEQVLVERLSQDDVLTGKEKITLATLTGGQFATLRSQYMNHSIKPGTALCPMAVLLDGKIAGCIAVSGPDSTSNPHMVYLLSDFPVSPVRYTRLAALMVRCAQSTEVKHLLQRSLSRRVEWVETTAFSNRPASMKYRSGQMRLLARREADDGIHRNQLQYGAEAGRWSLQEAYRGWWQKNGGFTTATESVEKE